MLKEDVETQFRPALLAGMRRNHDPMLLVMT
jgi:hypothetical protein